MESVNVNSFLQVRCSSNESAVQHEWSNYCIVRRRSLGEPVGHVPHKFFSVSRDFMFWEAVSQKDTVDRLKS